MAHGASPSTPNLFAKTALDLARQRGHRQLVRRLQLAQDEPGASRLNEALAQPVALGRLDAVAERVHAHHEGEEAETIDRHLPAQYSRTGICAENALL